MQPNNPAENVKSPSRRAVELPGSAIREIMGLASQMENVIHLEVGEPDFGTPEPIVEAGCEALRQGWTRYTMNAGIKSLRDRIAERVTAKTGTTCAPERVVVTVGAVGALYTAIVAVLDPGDEILIPDPGWPNYEGIARLVGGVPVRYRLNAENRFEPDLDEVEALLSPRTKAILINTPGNPTGAVFSERTMQGLVSLARRRGIYLISDEIYEDIVFDGRHVSALGRGIDDRVLMISGFSKSFAMTGWRLGYLVCPPDLAPVATKLQESLVSCAPAVSQRAAEAALVECTGYIDEFREIFRRRRDIVAQVFEGTDLLAATPAGAFYAFVRIGRSGRRSSDFCKAFLIEHAVATVPGVTFGPSCDDMIRIAFTTDDESLRTGLTRLREFLLS